MISSLPRRIDKSSQRCQPTASEEAAKLSKTQITAINPRPTEDLGYTNCDLGPSQLNREPLFEITDILHDCPSRMHSREPECSLSRPKSLPGMLQASQCHCSACCSCSPNQHNCFIPSFDLSRTTHSWSASLDANIDKNTEEQAMSGKTQRFESRKSSVDVLSNGVGKNRQEKFEGLYFNATDTATKNNVQFSQSSFADINPCSDIGYGFPLTQLTNHDSRSETLNGFCETEQNGVACKSPAQLCHSCLVPGTSQHLLQPCLKCGKHEQKINNSISSTSNAKSLSEFKQKFLTIRSWFKEFCDDEKNLVLQGLLEESNISQKHMLSVKLEYYSHDECQPNCRDYIGWLPDTVSFIIFSYLDPVSLCRVSCVSQRWHQIANDQSLWRHLSFLSKWRLSPSGEQKQLLAFQLPGGSVNWKGLFADRFRLQNNWIKGRCTVRTFEGHAQGVSCLQFDDNRIVSGSSDKTIKLWNIRTNSQWGVQTLVGHSGTVRCLHLDGNRLVSGSTDRTIKVWDLSSQQSWASIACKVTMVGHIDTVRCLKVDADKVISGSYDKTLKVWDIKTGNCRRTLRGHEAAVLCVQFDSTKIISGSCDKTIKVWTFEGECIMTLQGHHDAVTCLQFDDRRIISGSLDCTLRFWNVHNGHLINTIDWKASEGHTRVIRCLQADSWRVVSASDDKTIKVWSLETGQRLVTLRNHTDGVTCLQFNDSILVSGSYDKTVKLWDFSCC